MSGTKKCVHGFYSGRVQGVGFRFTAQDTALNLGVTGWVKNTRDGKVELIAEGGEETLKEFLKKIKEKMGYCISEENISWNPASGEFKDFGIRFY